MRGILIDPFDKTISNCLYDGTLEHMYKLLHCECITTVGIVRGTEHGETLFLDDEGLYADNQRFFMWRGYDQPLAGRGLVIGTDVEGNSVDTRLTVDFITPNITWPALRFSHITQTEETGDILGRPGTIIKQTPHFEDDEQQ